MNMQQKIPVTIITGFLGAGKTTFINNLLQKYSNTQFVLVENEFGDVSIDTKLIKGVDASQMFELKEGCICCSISDEYELVLQELADRFHNVDHLLIETTGIADPASVIRPFFADENLKEIYQYNGTVCLVDAINFGNKVEQEISLKQLVTADLIVINKVENLSESDKHNFQKEIQQINYFADIIFTHLADTKEIQLNSIVKKLRSEFDFVRLSSGHNHIQSKLLTFNIGLNKAEFIRWLSYTLYIYKNQIYRTKGILCFENEPYEYILQGIGGRFEITEGDLNLGEVKSEVVFIGKLEGLNLEF